MAVGISELMLPSMDIYVLKVDDSGQKIWEKTYGGKDQEFPVRIVETSDGGLIVAGVAGNLTSDEEVDAYLLRLGPAIGPLANFSVAPGDDPLKVNITDLSRSTDGIVSWHWDFGDGSTSSEANPTHTYSATGIYTVWLQVWEADDDSSEARREIHAGVRELPANLVILLLAMACISRAGEWSETIRGQSKTSYRSTCRRSKGRERSHG